MTHFKRQLEKHAVSPKGRRWFFIPYDQLSDAIGPLSREEPRTTGIIIIENPWKAARRPYHKQKLALILSNLRHFALEQARRGVAVRHIVADGPYHRALRPLAKDLGLIRVMTPAERELRKDLQVLVDEKIIEMIPHEGWLTTSDDFNAGARSRPPWRMDTFYRFIRRKTGVLMQKDQPIGGKFSFDSENRLPWKGIPPAPKPPIFSLDPIKEEVGKLIETHFSHHPGRLDLNALPATLDDAQNLWSWAKEECLPWFGPYEDAMSVKSRTLFHTRISALLNIHRLVPAKIIAEVANMKLPLQSREAFIRQVLGWREFVRHVHFTTDGFRKLPSGKPPISKVPGDGGYRRWAGRPWSVMRTRWDPDGGAVPSFLGADHPLPSAYWGKPSGLSCLDYVVADVWAEGYSHHITRLMVLSNIAALLDVAPRELTDWFWVAYTDAYDWVVEPNVLGMGTYALGDLMTTKPYVSGVAYIHRMSDFCSLCSFNPATNCPLSRLYWAFLARHEGKLKDNPRLRMPMASLRRRSQKDRKEDRRIFDAVWRIFGDGRPLSPRELAA